MKRAESKRHLGHKIYISSDDKNPSRSIDEYNITIPLNTELQNVVSVELTSWAIPEKLITTFIGRYILDTLPYPDVTNTRSNNSGNMQADMEIINEFGTAQINFTLDLEFVIIADPGIPVTYAGQNLTIPEITAALQQAIPLAIDAQAHATLTTANYTVNVGVDSLNRFFVNMHIIGDSTTQASVQMLFKTGANVSDSMNLVLGLPAEDTTIDPLTSGVQSLCAIDPTPFRYIDIELKQVAQYNPITRLFTSNDVDFHRPANTPEKPRLMTDPLRRVFEFEIKIRLKNGQTPNPEISGRGYDFGFDILTLEPAVCVPPWVKQKLLY